MKKYDYNPVNNGINSLSHQGDESSQPESSMIPAGKKVT